MGKKEKLSDIQFSVPSECSGLQLQDLSVAGSMPEPRTVEGSSMLTRSLGGQSSWITIGKMWSTSWQLVLWEV